MYETEDRLREQIADQQEQIEFLRGVLKTIQHQLLPANPLSTKYTAQMMRVHVEVALSLTVPRNNKE